MFHIKVTFVSRGYFYGEMTQEISACSIEELGKAIKNRAEEIHLELGYTVLTNIAYDTLICGRKGDPDEVERLQNFFT